MKIYRNTFLICITLMLIILLILVFVPYCVEKSLFKDILVGAFASFIVSAIITLTQYFHEKSKILSDLYQNLVDFYFNILVISKMTGNLLATRHKGIKELNREMKNIDNIIKLLPKQDSFNTSQYYGFCELFLKRPNGFKILLDSINSFSRTKHFVNQKFSNCIEMGLEYETYLLESEVKKLKGEVFISPDFQSRKFEDDILIWISRNYEYQTSLIYQVDKLQEVFSKYYHPKNKWSTLKGQIINSVDNLKELRNVI